jgi:hypothetical protein
MRPTAILREWQYHVDSVAYPCVRRLSNHEPNHAVLCAFG